MIVAWLVGSVSNPGSLNTRASHASTLQGNIHYVDSMRGEVKNELYKLYILIYIDFTINKGLMWPYEGGFLHKFYSFAINMKTMLVVTSYHTKLLSAHARDLFF